MSSACTSTDHVTFRWNDHVSYLSKLLSFQRIEEHFCDVTLITDDCFVIKAHQAVLATTSGYFEKVLNGVSSDQHPIIVLSGANFRELNCVLDYTYQGVMRVDQHMMESVLELADMLEIKGLSKMKKNPSIKKLFSSPSSIPSTSGEVLQGFISPSSSPQIQPNVPLFESQNMQSFITSENQPQSYLQSNSQSTNVCHSTFNEMKNDEGRSSMKERCEETVYLDQTSGIDLSLSRGVQMDRDSCSQIDEMECNRARNNIMVKPERSFNDSSSEIQLSKLTEIELREETTAKRKNNYDSLSEEDEDDEESWHFVYPSMQKHKYSIQDDSSQPLLSDHGDEKRMDESNEKIKRPLQPYQLFVRDLMPKYTCEYPHLSPKIIMKHIASRWKDITEEKKLVYVENANKLQEEHHKLHPNYIYSPLMSVVRKNKRKLQKRHNKLMYFNPFK